MSKMRYFVSCVEHTGPDGDVFEFYTESITEMQRRTLELTAQGVRYKLSKELREEEMD